MENGKKITTTYNPIIKDDIIMIMILNHQYGKKIKMVK